MSDVIEQIREKLANFPQARAEFDASSITVSPSLPDGFIVRLIVEACGQRERYKICYNGSHEETTHTQSAITLFAFGLSTNCRLREYSRMGRAYRWVVESWNPERNRWDADWDTVRWCLGLLLFWRRPMVRYLQNRFIDLDSRDSVYVPKPSSHDP